MGVGVGRRRLLPIQCEAVIESLSSSPIGARPRSRQRLVCFFVVVAVVTHTRRGGGRMIRGGGNDQRPLAGAATTLLSPTAEGGGDVCECQRLLILFRLSQGQKSLFCPNDLGQNSFVPIVSGTKYFFVPAVNWARVAPGLRLS